MTKIECVGCNKEELYKVTLVTENITAGLCKECYQMVEQRFFKTEKRNSDLIRRILGL